MTPKSTNNPFLTYNYSKPKVITLNSTRLKCSLCEKYSY